MGGFVSDDLLLAKFPSLGFKQRLAEEVVKQKSDIGDFDKVLTLLQNAAVSDTSDAFCWTVIFGVHEFPFYFCFVLLSMAPLRQWSSGDVVVIPLILVLSPRTWM